MAFGRKRTAVGSGKPGGLGPKPVVLPSERKENAGQDPNVALVPKRGVWGALGGKPAGEEASSSTTVEATAPEAGHPGPPAPHSAPKPSQTAVTGPAWGGAGLPARIQEQAEIAKDVPDEPQHHYDSHRDIFGAQHDAYSGNYPGRLHDAESFGGPHPIPNKGMVESRLQPAEHIPGAPNMPSANLPMAPPPPPPPRNVDFHGDFHGGADRAAPYNRQPQHGGNQRRDTPVAKHPGFSPEGNFSAKMVAMSGRGQGGRRNRRDGPDNRSSGAGRSHHAHEHNTHRSSSQASSSAADAHAAVSTSVDVEPLQQPVAADASERSAERSSAPDVAGPLQATMKPAAEATVVQSATNACDPSRSMMLSEKPNAPAAVHTTPDSAGPPATSSSHIMRTVHGQPAPSSMQTLPGAAAVPILRGIADTGGVPVPAGVHHVHSAGLPQNIQVVKGAIMQQMPPASHPQGSAVQNMYPSRMGGMQPHIPAHMQRQVPHVVPHNIMQPVAAPQHHPRPRVEQAHSQSSLSQVVPLLNVNGQAAPSRAHPNTAHPPAASSVADVSSTNQTSATGRGGRHQAGRGSRGASHHNAGAAAPVEDGMQESNELRKGSSDARSDGYAHGRGHNGARTNTSRHDSSTAQERRARGSGEKHDRQQAGNVGGSRQHGHEGPPDVQGRGHVIDGRGRRDRRGQGRGGGRGTGERDIGDASKPRTDFESDHTRGDGGAVEGRPGEGRGHLRGRGRRQDAAVHAEGSNGDVAPHTARLGAQQGRARAHGHNSGRGRTHKGLAADAAGTAGAVDVREGCAGGCSSAQNDTAAAPVRVGKSHADQVKGAGRVQPSRCGKNSHVGESVNVENAAPAATSAAEAASVSVGIAPQVFTQALAKLEAFNIQDAPKIPVPSSAHRPVRDVKARRGQGKGRLQVEIKERLKDTNTDASS